MTQTRTIRVVAAVIQNEGQLLLCQRPIHKRHGGLWEFPGGKMELEESPLDATRRELAEELGVAVRSVGNLLFTIHDPGSPFVIEFYPTDVNGDPQCLEHASLTWVTLDQARELPLAPSDRRFVEHLTQAGADR
jgi:mutator protein MutT